MKRQILFVFGRQACVPDDPLLAAQELGCQTTVLGGSIPCGLSTELVSRFEKVNLSDTEEVLSTVRALHAYRPLHAVVGYDDEAVPIVARIAAELGLPGNPVEAANAARDKFLMKQRFAAEGLPIASYHLAAGEDDAVNWASAAGYPVVVKPVRGSASQGVIRANTESELRQAYRRLRRIVREQSLDTGERTDSEQLVESYIDGREYSVEFLIIDGTPNAICIFEKPQPLEGPFFEETIYVTPPRLAPDHQLAILALAERAVTALGLRNGPAHCEIRLSSTGPFVLEIGARLIGGACSRVFRHILDDDIHSYVLRLALGDQIQIPRQQSGAAGAMMFPIPKEGRLISISGVEKAQSIPGIQDVTITACPGDIIITFPEQSCYIGFLTAKADTSEAATEMLNRAAGSIELKLDDLGCERWIRRIDNHKSYQPATEYNIKSLGDFEIEAARETVLPIIAAAHFGELPPDLSLEEARKCIKWLEAGNKGETAASFWFIADDRGAALGSFSGETCYVSCLSVVPGNRRSGIGAALVRTIMSVFAQRGCTKMEVLVDQHETGSTGLFKRLGFTAEALGEQTCCTC